MKVGIVGLGYVGLPLAVAFAEAGDEVVALDVDPLQGRSGRRRRVLHRGHPVRAPAGCAAEIRATSRYADLAQADAVIICVPTPLTENREPDLGALDAPAKSLAKCSSAGSWSCSSRRPIRARRASG